MSCDFWKTAPTLPRPALSGTKTADVAVIGGGMAGVLIAHRLVERGASVILLDSARLGSGQTAGTTAKVTAQHGLFYAPLAARRGEAVARLYAAVNRRAVADLRRLVSERGIDCDWVDADAYIFSLTDRHTLEEEAAAQRAAGLAARFTTKTELPVQVAGAVQVAGQAHFHPQKFLHAVAAPLTVYEHSPVRRVEGNTLFTDRGTVQAPHIVFACHYPFINFPGLFFTRLHQERSYVLALSNAPRIQGMYREIDGGKISLRQQGNTLLLGGSGHRTGEEAGGHYAELRAAASEWAPNAQEIAHWSAQDVLTPDGVPYIGRFSHRPGWYIATGFGKWGMSTSMVAANLLAALIGGYAPPEAAVFSPTRLPLRDWKAVANESGHAVKGLARGWIHRSAPENVRLARGEGGVVRLNGHAVGLYHAPDDSWYAVDPQCPHLGCALEWNPDEKTWDCPCHGSRFDFTGQLLNDPAQRGLAHTKRATVPGKSRGE